jgi:hypothetical protein
MALFQPHRSSLFSKEAAVMTDLIGLFVSASHINLPISMEVNTFIFLRRLIFLEKFFNLSTSKWMPFKLCVFRSMPLCWFMVANKKLVGIGVATSINRWPVEGPQRPERILKFSNHIYSRMWRIVEMAYTLFGIMLKLLGCHKACHGHTPRWQKTLERGD